MKQPRDYPRRLLVAVIGSSPAIVTETLYVLAVSQPKRFVPTEIRLITTEVGAKPAKGSLLRPDGGGFHRLRADYDLPPIAFGPKHIHVLEDASGRPLSDIRSPEDNECAADTITRVVRDLTSDDGSALHVSLAGGRKTMGFYIGYALSLYGREQDRLSHVLVSEPYERCPEFFYPTPRTVMVHTREPNSRAVDARNAQVTLAEIPFVRLREGPNRQLMKGAVTFSAAVADAQRALPPLSLHLEPATRMVTAGGMSFRMRAGLFATYWMLAERACRGKPGVYHQEKGVPYERYRYYRRLVGEMSGRLERAELKYFGGGKPSKDVLLSDTNFNPDSSNINKQLKAALGPRRAEPYLIKQQDRAPVKGRRHRHGLALAPEEIRIVGGEVSGSVSASPSQGRHDEEP